MKAVIRYGIILSLICVLASASLAIVNSITKPIIIARAKAEEQATLRKVMPEGIRFQPVKPAEDEEDIYYKVYNKEEEFIGVAFKAAGKGYSSVIETMAGMKKDGSITAIKILSQNETPGLGNSITEPSFTARFMNKNMQGLSKIEAITGATISSKALIDSVQKKAKEIKELIDEQILSGKSGAGK